MIEDAGVLIEEQRVRSQQATASRSAGDYPYTGFDLKFRISLLQLCIQNISIGKVSKNGLNTLLKLIQIILRFEIDILFSHSATKWKQFKTILQLKQIGTTENGRRILGLHMGDKNNDSPKKKIFMGKISNGGIKN